MSAEPCLCEAGTLVKSFPAIPHRELGVRGLRGNETNDHKRLQEFWEEAKNLTTNDRVEGKVDVKLDPLFVTACKETFSTDHA